MKKLWLHVLLGMGVMLLGVGCAHKGGPVTTSQAVRDYQIVQSMEDGGTKVISAVIILEDGRYQWNVRDWWSNPIQNYSFSGRLPEEMMKQLQKENRRFEVVDGRRLYQWKNQEDPETTPASVRNIFHYLQATHIAPTSRNP